MYTNEFLMNATVTTIMDSTAALDDVQLVINDNNVVLRQWNEQYDDYDYVALSHQMWNNLLQALDKPEGVFK